MDNLIILALSLTAACYEADMKVYNKCVKEAKNEVAAKMDCKPPIKFQGAGLYLGRPYITASGNENCYEVRAKYVGDKEGLVAALTDWNKSATKVFIPFTDVKEPVVNSVPKAAPKTAPKKVKKTKDESVKASKSK
jgi:hypothetical protein